MPLSIHKKVFDQAILGIWKIEEDAEYFLEALALTQEEHLLVDRMKGRRKIEWLSSRHLVHLMSERVNRAEILKDEHGKPYIHDSDHFISFSHTHGMSAAIASKKVVGVDIQNIVPKITRIAPKFINSAEWKQVESHHNDLHLDLMHIIWGAKESLYKAYGKRGLDFKEHMSMTELQWNGDKAQFEGHVRKGDFNKRYDIFAEKIQQHILVYAEEI